MLRAIRAEPRSCLRSRGSWLRGKPPEMTPILRVSELDAMYAGEPMWWVLGPVDMRTDAEIAARLNNMMQSCPTSRIGVIPGRNSRNWKTIPEPGEGVVVPACRTQPVDINDALRCAVSKRPCAPFSVWRCGPYTCVCCDHGLGDGTVREQIAEIFMKSSGSPTVLTSAVETRNPFRSALWNVCISAEQRDDSRSLTAVSVSGGSYKEIREYRDTFYPKMSITALVIHKIREAFALSGVDLSSSVEVVADLRRDLPSGVITQGNFVALLRVPLSADTTAAEFSNLLRNEVQSYRPLIMLGRSLLRSKIEVVWNLARGRAPRPEAAKISSAAKITLCVSDNTRLPDGVEIPWKRREGSEQAIAVLPASDEQVSMLLTLTGDEKLQVTACFYETRINRGVVEEALTGGVMLPRNESGGFGSVGRSA